jgi:hypothetical protein
VTQKINNVNKNYREARITHSTEKVMDANWNRIIDNGAVRIGLIVAIFAVWLAISYGLLAA